MPIIAKPVDQVTADDLKALAGQPESQNVQFRREAYSAHDDGQLEMLRDVSAMANATGGHLLIGARADNRGNLAAVDGVENGGAEAQRLLTQCGESIREQIVGLQAAAVDTGRARQTVLVFVPESMAAPHMVAFEGAQEFWRRYGTTRNKMSAAEIRAAFLESGDLSRRADEVHEQRKQVFLNAIGGQPYIRLASAALGVRRDVIDPSDQSIAVLLMSRRWAADSRESWGMTDPAGETGSNVPAMKPFAEGFAVEVADRRHQEVLRNGFVEFHAPAAAFDLRPERPGLAGLTINPRALCEVAIDFMHLVQDVGERAQMTVPLVARMGIYNARAVDFYPFPHGYSGPTQTNRWQETEHLEVSTSAIPRPFDPVRAAKDLLDRLWNAFGHAGCPFFDVRGRYIFAPKE